MAPLVMSLSDLESHFGVSYLSHTLGNTAHVYM